MKKKRFTTEELNTIMDLADNKKKSFTEIAKIVKEMFGVERTPTAFAQRIYFIRRTSTKPTEIVNESKTEPKTKKTSKTSKNNKNIILKCGHAPNAEDQFGNPACAICNRSEVSVFKPDLKNRNSTLSTAVAEAGNNS